MLPVHSRVLLSGSNAILMLGEWGQLWSQSVSLARLCSLFFDKDVNSGFGESRPCLTSSFPMERETDGRDSGELGLDWKKGRVGQAPKPTPTLTARASHSTNLHQRAVKPNSDGLSC
jgi:hypothetical protein